MKVLTQEQRRWISETKASCEEDLKLPSIRSNYVKIGAARQLLDMLIECEA